MELVEDPHAGVFRCPKPVEQLRHESQILGPPGRNHLRRLKNADEDHWYLFNRSGLAVGRISPTEWAKALAGVEGV